MRMCARAFVRARVSVRVCVRARANVRVCACACVRSCARAGERARARACACAQVSVRALTRARALQDSLTVVERVIPGFAAEKSGRIQAPRGEGLEGKGGGDARVIRVVAAAGRDRR